MCLFIAAIMLLLFFYFSAQIVNYKLVEIVDLIPVDLESGWDLLIVLWPAMLFMFLAGVLFTLIVMKFIKSK